MAADISEAANRKVLGGERRANLEAASFSTANTPAGNAASVATY
jgi:hypothetical protein